MTRVEADGKDPKITPGEREKKEDEKFEDFSGGVQDCHASSNRGRSPGPGNANKRSAPSGETSRAKVTTTSGEGGKSTCKKS